MDALTLGFKRFNKEKFIVFKLNFEVIFYGVKFKISEC
jgi:hypothetical protein